MIEVYIKGNEDYESNGDMTLTPTTCEAELTVEGVSELTLEHPIDDLGRWEYLVTDNVIAAPTPYSKKQLFRIYDYTKTETEVTAYARHIFYDSAGEMLVDVRPTDKTGQEALDIILSGTKYKAKTNIKTRSTTYYIRKNIMEAIGGDDENSFINRWGGERMYDNFTVIINDRLGGDYGACAEFGRNMTGIEADISIDDVVTRIIPESYNGYTLEGEEPWVDSSLIGNYANTRAAVIKFEDVKLLEDCQEGEEGFGTLELLREELKRRCEKEYENGLDKPKVNYKVNLVEIADTDDYKDYKKLTTIGIGDDVLIRDRKLKINVTARCIRLVYDCIEEENTEIELGNYTENYFDKTTSAADIIQKVTREDGTLKAEEVYGKIDAVKAQLKAQRDISQPSEVRAVLFEDLVEGSPTYGAMSIGTMGFCIASERTADGKNWDWKTFGTGRGFYADYVCIGQLDGALIRADSIKADSISIDYRKSVESHISEAVETSERNYKNTIDELKSDFKKMYTTFRYVDETAGSLASEAETNAKGYTEEQLKKYVTIVEMGTKIDQTAEEIKTEASKTYTSFQYVDETAGNLANEAENNANSYTEEQLKNYSTTVEVESIIRQNADDITAEVKRATSSEEKLSSKIKQNADSITTKVSKGDVSSEISQEAGSVSIKANRFSVESTNLKIEENGNVTSNNGTFTAAEITSNFAQDSSGWATSGLKVQRDGTLKTKYISVGGGGVSTVGNVIANGNITSNEGSVTAKYTVSGNFLYAGDGGIATSGKKSRVVNTNNYGYKELYCYEMPTPIFGDMGNGRTDKNGICVVFLDDIFTETVNTRRCMYHVFLTPYGKAVLYVSERSAEYFIVRGEPNIEFAWEIKAKQREYEYARLETHEMPEEEEDLLIEASTYIETLVLDNGLEQAVNEIEEIIRI